MTKEIKELRRQVIIDAARELISVHGSVGLNMKELATLAGVPRASLYRMYSSKEHIISEITLDLGVEFAQRLQAEKPRGKTAGAKITYIFKRLLQEAESDPRLIAAVLESLVSNDSNSIALQLGIEALLPKLLSLAVDVDSLPDANCVIDVLLRLLLANLQMMTSGRVSLQEALGNMTFAAERLMGSECWKS